MGRSTMKTTSIPYANNKNRHELEKAESKIHYCQQFIIQINNMFFGRIITKDTPFIYNQEALEEPLGDVITVSNITLAPSSKESASVFFKKDGEEFLICTLTQKNPHVPVNLYIEGGENLTILVKGNGIAHVIGFFEPQPKIEHLDEVELHHKHECQHNHSDHHHHHEPAEEEPEPVQPIKPSPKNQTKQAKSPQTKPIEKTFSLEQEVESAQINDDSDESEGEDESDEISQSEQSDLKGLNDLDDDIGEEQPRKQKNNFDNNKQKNKQSNQNHKQQENVISNKKEKVHQSSDNQPKTENQKNERKVENSQNINRNGNKNHEKSQSNKQHHQGKNKHKQNGH